MHTLTHNPETSLLILETSGVRTHHINKCGFPRWDTCVLLVVTENAEASYTTIGK